MSQRPAEWVDDVFASLREPSDAELRVNAVDKVQQAIARREIPPYVMLVVWILFGEIDRAMEITLAVAAEQGAIYELEIVFIDEFEAFRRHSDFPKLMDGLGITRQWQSAGCSFEAGQLFCPE